MTTSTSRARDHAARQLLVINVPRGDEIDQAPELIPWIDQGWKVIDATPRVTEKGAKLLVTLRRENRQPLPCVVMPDGAA